MITLCDHKTTLRSMSPHEFGTNAAAAATHTNDSHNAGMRMPPNGVLLRITRPAAPASSGFVCRMTRVQNDPARGCLQPARFWLR